MLKYHFFLHWHAAGISHEATSTSLLMMVHVYVGSQLGCPDSPKWPDMEYALFNQDPRWVLFKFPETPEEARDAFDLATAQRTVKQLGTYSLDRLNFERTDLGLPRYDPSNKAQLFRDASVFGDTVYLPKGASGCWIQKVPGGAFDGKLDAIVKALLEASDPKQTRGRLARAMNASQGLTLEPINRKKGLTSIAILLHYAYWLHADMVDMCFDWAQMQRQCSDAWKSIYHALSEDPLWDTSLSRFKNPPQKAADAITNPSPVTGNYPRFINITGSALKDYLTEKDEEMDCERQGVCIKTMIKYHGNTARLFTDDGPLSVDLLYKRWTEEERQERKELLQHYVEEADAGGREYLARLFKKQGIKSIMGSLTRDDGDCAPS